MAQVDRCSSCGTRLYESDEGFDGVCALCAVDECTQPRRKRRPTFDDFIGTQTIDAAAIEWVANLVGV